MFSFRNGMKLLRLGFQYSHPGGTDANVCKVTITWPSNMLVFTTTEPQHVFLLLCVRQPPFNEQKTAQRFCCMLYITVQFVTMKKFWKFA